MMGNNGGNTRERTLRIVGGMLAFVGSFNYILMAFPSFPLMPYAILRRSAPYCLARAVRQQLYKQYAGLAFVFIYSFYCPLLRYLAVTQPLTYSKKWRCKRLALLMILGVWLLAFLITCPPLFGW